MAKKQDQLHNNKQRDSGGKLIFENATLCSQFLREYTGIEALKHVRPEDIEDMTERFVPMFTEERNSDVVKRVHLSDENELFLITLIEHKSSVDYNVSMQLLRYMVFIWEDYENRMNKTHAGASRTKDFKYPPILPIVYYEDTAEWTAVLDFRDRVFLNDVFSEFIPSFRYFLFKLQEHGQKELLSHRDEISLVMLINRLRNSREIRDIHFPDGYLQEISSRAPSDVLRTLSLVIATYLRELNVSESEINDLTDQIKERKMGRLFEHFEGYDIQEMRRKIVVAGIEGEARGITRGEDLRLIRMVCRKLKKQKNEPTIAEELDEDLETIHRICLAAKAQAPDYNVEKIYQVLHPEAADFDTDMKEKMLSLSGT